MRIFLLLVFSSIGYYSNAQFLMDLIDTTTDIGKSVLSVSERFNHVRIGGYIQPQFQGAQAKGAKGYAGGDFAPNVNNRFMIRRGRIRFDYVRFNKTSKASVQFVFQFDGSERGVFIRDFWGRFFENKLQLFSFVAGMFARPFSYELNLSSSDRESPERGRMSQILMKTERDLGAMISFEPRKPNHPLRFLKIDAGLFNGQGLTAPGDFDSHKDFIARAGLKPYRLSPRLTLSFAGSYLNGGLLQSTRYIYSMNTASKNFNVDSSASNPGRIAPRKYYGADAQLKIKCAAGFTELRAEYIAGTQTGLPNTTETPAVLPDPAGSLYIRKFNGAYFYFLQNFINPSNQFIIKYDWYDPNTLIKEKEIGKPGSNLTAADVRFSTLGIGYISYINENVKLVLWYDKIWNEKTQLSGFADDVKDDVFTCRLQFRF
ncbi:MAG: porin [Ginsengibacter sp.]